MARAGPRPGTLEWLSDQRGDEVVLLTPGGSVTRAAWEARAEALAGRLAGTRGVTAGDLLTATGRVDPAWFTCSWAAAKLGAGLAGLPPGPVVAPARTLHVEAAEHTAAGAGGAGPRRLSGAHEPPDAITFSRRGRTVRRSFTPAAMAAIGACLADLVARVRALPGTTLVAAGPVSDPVVTFVASVVLVGGGRVVTAADPAAALSLGAEHDATLAVLSPADLDALARLPANRREALDTTGLRTLVIGGAPFAITSAEDLFGDVTDVYATAGTGVVAVRGPGERVHALLDGVEARTTPGGLLEVRSPLAAASGWNATGDRASLVADAALRLEG